VLVDITPHTLGVSALGELHGFLSPHSFSPIIPRNAPLPVSQTEIYATVVDDQEAAKIRVFQGENHDTRYNSFVGEFMIEGLAEVPAGNQILVRLDLDLSGILKVTATERATGLARHVVIDNAMERFHQRQRSDALDRLEAVFGTIEDQYEPTASPEGPEPYEGSSRSAHVETMAASLRQTIESADALAAKADRLLLRANAEDAEELRGMLADLRASVELQSEDKIRNVLRELEDLVFYLEDA
jgi:molecular chaperone DnaK